MDAVSRAGSGGIRELRPVVGVPRETCPGERRVALTPEAVPLLAMAGFEVVVESGAGEGAGIPDGEYRTRGARIAGREEVFDAEVLVQVRTASANRARGGDDLPLLRPGQVVIGYANALASPQALAEAAERKITTFALDLVPRGARAGGEDVAASEAAVWGYRAVLLAAGTLQKVLPGRVAAWETVAAARVVVVGAGAAGLAAIDTARRLGATVEAYDVDSGAREQVERLGAVFVHLDLGPAASSEAPCPPEELLARERGMIAGALRDCDVLLLSAGARGCPAPRLVTAEMVEAMPPGAVVVDLTVGLGGTCELSRPDETVVVDGVTVLAPTHLASTAARQASEAFSRGIVGFLLPLVEAGELRLWPLDEIHRATLVTIDGDVVHPRVLALLGEDRWES